MGVTSIVLYTSRWRSVEDAERWLTSEEFRRFDSGARPAGAIPRIERYRVG